MVLRDSECHTLRPKQNLPCKHFEQSCKQANVMHTIMTTHTQKHIILYSIMHTLFFGSNGTISVILKLQLASIIATLHIITLSSHTHTNK